MTFQPEAALIAASVLLVVISVWLTARFIRARDRRARVRRAARAARAERRARGVLEDAGFRVRGEQVRKSWSLSSDGREVRFDLVADYVVERDGRVWVAEVKTGERALDLRFGPTRRQLLEYREAFGVDGVLLVDAEADGFSEIHFRGAAQRARHPLVWWWFLAGAGLGAAVAIWLAAA
jgi:hypothetical protein